MLSPLHSRLQQDALDAAAADLRTGSQLLGPVQRPATAATVHRMGHRSGQGALSIGTHHTTGGATGQKIRKTLLDAGR